MKKTILVMLVAIMTFSFTAPEKNSVPVDNLITSHLCEMNQTKIKIDNSENYFRFQLVQCFETTTARDQALNYYLITYMSQGNPPPNYGTWFELGPPLGTTPRYCFGMGGNQV